MGTKIKRYAAVMAAMLLLLAQTAASAASCNVAAIMYHDISASEGRLSDWCITPEMLEEDIKYFTDRGYITITAGELANESMENLDGKKILLLTFDDGYISWYTDVYPILKRNNAKATMFIVGAYINRYGYLSETQIREMANSGLIEIGNHTDRVHQMPLEVLQELYDRQSTDIITDICNNSARLSQITGKDITSLAWPYGYSTAALDWRVKEELGCSMSFSTKYGVNVYQGDSSMIFNRINRDLSVSTEELFEEAESQF